jgi:hypothetical protein
VLARRIGADPALADQAGDRSGIDDGATARGQHRRNLVFHRQEDALEIDVDEAGPGDLLLVGDGKSARTDAGIVEGYVQPPECRDCAFDHGAAIGFAADVGGNRRSFPTFVFDQRDGRLCVRLVLIDHDEAAALFGKEPGSRPADARTSAGDQDATINKAAGHAVPLTHPAR